MAVSLYHQGANLDRDRVRELTGAQDAPAAAIARPQVRDWLLEWIDRDVTPLVSLDSLPGVVHHAADAWTRRKRPNVVLVHYADLVADLEGEMRRLASVLDIAVPGERWGDLVSAATFSAMQSRADSLVPNRLGVLKDRAAFFRSGRSGAGRELLTEAEYAHYLDRLAALGPADVIAWLNR